MPKGHNSDQKVCRVRDSEVVDAAVVCAVVADAVVVDAVEDDAVVIIQKLLMLL